MDLKHEGEIRFRHVALVLANIILAALLFLCYIKEDRSKEQKENAALIGMSYMTMNNEFYSIVSEVITSRIEAEEDRYLIRDPGLDWGRQKRQIENMVEQGIDVLVVTPVDSRRIISTLKEVKEKGIYVIVVDCDIAEDGIADCTITSDNYEAGRLIGEYYSETHDTGNVVIMTHNSALSGAQRVNGFIDAIKSNPGLQIAAMVECEGQTEIAMPQMKNLIETGIQFDDVFCLNDLAAVGVVAALEENDMLKDTDVYGVDASPDAKALIFEGMMTATAAQYPTKIGNAAAEVIYQCINGEKVESTIRIPVSLVNNENVENYDIDRWQ